MIPGKAHKQRMSLEPRLQITDKVVVNSINLENSKSEKEAHLMESFQVMNYFLANALYAIFPLMIEAVKYMKVERGEFAYSEEPDKELRRDADMRILLRDVFDPLKTNLYKIIQRKFLKPTEQSFI